MDRAAVRPYIARTQALVDSAPPATREETRTWVVDPLLETLGWDLHSTTTESNTTVSGVSLEYVLSIDRTPALFVAVESFTDPLSEQRERTLRRAMATTGVDRAIYTNGQTVVLLASPDGSVEVDHFQCPLESLHDATDHLKHVSRARLQNRLERHSRAFAARRLAVERTDIATAIVDDLIDRTGESYEAELRTAAGQFLDDLVREFSQEPAHRSGTLEFDDGSENGLQSQTDTDTGRESGVDSDDEDGTGGDTASTEDCGDQKTLEEADGPSRFESDREQADVPRSHSNVHSRSHESPTEGDALNSDADIEDDDPNHDTRYDEAIDEGVTSTTAEDDAPTTTDETDSDHEYVVRFFNDRGSIGAIGHSESDAALVHAAEFLFDRGLSGIDVPWPDDSATVVNDEPLLADGTPMDQPHELSNGYVLDTVGPLEQQAARVEALAARAGLRAMLTGDWPE